MRKKHAIKEIEEVLSYAEAEGWTIVISARGHAWGLLRCPHNSPKCRCGDFCQMSVWSTPRNPQNHAKQLKNRIDGCTYESDEQA